MCLKGETDFGQQPGKAFTQSHTNADAHNAEHAVIKKHSTQVNLGSQMAAIKSKGKEYIMPQVFPKHLMATEDTVRVIEASALYQPVQGTNGNSRYFIMGIGTGLSLAVRMKGSTLSARVEGERLSKMTVKSALEQIGLTYGKNGTYASMHAECPDTLTAQKTVGSILAALGNHTTWNTPMPTVALIAGIGV